MPRPASKYDETHIQNLLHYIDFVLSKHYQMRFLISALRAIRSARETLLEHRERRATIKRLNRARERLRVRMVKLTIRSITQGLESARQLVKEKKFEVAALVLRPLRRRIKRIRTAKPAIQKIIESLTGKDYLAVAQSLNSQRWAIKKEMKRAGQLVVEAAEKSAKEKRQRFREEVARLMKSIPENLARGIHEKTARQLEQISNPQEKAVMVEILGNPASVKRWLTDQRRELERIKAGHLRKLRKRNHK